MCPDYSKADLDVIARMGEEIDSGKTKYIINNNVRLAIPDVAFVEFSLVNGQEVDDELLRSIARFNISYYAMKVLINTMKGCV